MDNAIQSALKNLIENQATADELELLRQSFSSGQIFIGGNVQNSIIIVGSGNSVQLTPKALDILRTPNNLSALHQLPQPPADFVGREQELKKVLKNLDKKRGASISGLVGMGGIGKTALGVVAAHSIVEKYPDAQFFIDLRGTSKKPLKALDVMKHIVQSINPTVDLSNSTDDEIAGAYQSALVEKKAILLLDNAHDASQITPLLPPDNCFMLVTSRWHFTVPGIHSVKMDVLKPKDSVKLLTGICPRLTKGDALRIAELCGYLPIALRLAASYLQVHTDWTPDEFIVQLSNKTKRLQALHLEGADTNIEASFEQSYQQLSKEEQRYWSVLSIFPTTFKRDALAAVWSLDDETSQKLVGKLCQYSLVDYDPVKDRYGLHDLLADFAHTKLEQKDEIQSLINYAMHYRNVWFAAEEFYAQSNDDMLRGLTLFDSEYLHIQSVYLRSAENFSIGNKLLVVLKEIPNFGNLLRSRLHPNEQIKWFLVALEAAQKLEDAQNENKLLGNIGTAYIYLGDNRKAIEYLEKALKIAENLGDKQRIGFWLGNLGGAYANLGDARKAIHYWKQTLEIAREVGDKRRQGGWLGNIGTVYSDLCEERNAIDQYKQALEIARDLGDRQQEALWLCNMGNEYCNLNENLDAINYLELSLSIANEIGDKKRMGVCLGNIGTAYVNLGESNKAIEYLTSALSIAKEIGDQQHESEWLNQFGELYLKLKETEHAKKNLELALNISKELGLREVEGKSVFNLARLSLLQSEHESALKYVQDARLIFESIQSRRLLEKADRFIESLNQTP